MPSDGFARKLPYRIPSPKLHGIIAPWMLRPDLDSSNTSVRTSADYPLEHEESIEENIRNDLGQPSISESDINNDEIWYSEEDTLLRRLRESGNLSWNDVSKQFRRRSAHACCKRYELLLLKDLCKTNLVRLMKRIDCKLGTRGKVSLSAYKRMSLCVPEKVCLSLRSRDHI